jgi:predicted lipid-binding transport protein (Tim44 family)
MEPRSVEPALPFVDPGFDASAFLEQTRAAFYTVKRAWAQLKPEISRHLMVEELWQSQKAAMEVLRLDGCRNVLDGIAVDYARINEAVTVGSFDRLQVNLTVSGHDHVVRDSDGEVLRGDPQAGSWHELWTMQRFRDPEAPRVGVESSTCPECGSPLHLDEDGLCEFCHAVVPGIKSDWLVVEIARATGAAAHGAFDKDAAEAGRQLVIAALAEEAAERGGAVHGMQPLPIDPGAEVGIAVIQAHDPHFLPGDFLAEARTTFVRLDESRNEVLPRLVRPLVGDAFYAGEVARAEAAGSEGRHLVDAYLDVSGVTLAAASSDGTTDRLVARVTATSAIHEIDLNHSTLLSGSNTIRRWHAELTFERSAAARSDALRADAAGMCPACGELDTVNDAGECAACGKHVTGGEFSWVLVGEVRREH